VVQETLFWSLSNRTTERNATVGHSLSGRIDSIEPDESVAVARLDSPEKPEAIRPTREGDSMRWSFDGTDKSGFYTASVGQGADRRGETFAVNIDVAESDLTRADLQQLPAELRAGAIDGDESSPGVAPLERRSGWSEPILLGVLALLVAEIAVAWRFGRRRT
jgi:hypothetical protein